MSKTAIVVFSDPKAGSEEALGRLFNAMFLTLELKEKGQEVSLIFQGAGTRWPGEITKPLIRPTASITPSPIKWTVYAEGAPMSSAPPPVSKPRG
jgi:hypothetical protein